MMLKWENENENEKNNCDNEEGKGVSESDNNQDGSLAYQRLGQGERQGYKGFE